jgi:hypothetical protein
MWPDSFQVRLLSAINIINHFSFLDLEDSIRFLEEAKGRLSGK